MNFELSEKAKKELKEIEDKIRGDRTDEEWESVKNIRDVCEFYRYQVLSMEHLDVQGKRDWIKRLVESKVKEERERVLKIIDEMSLGIEKKSRFELLQELKNTILEKENKSENQEQEKKQ